MSRNFAAAATDVLERTAARANAQRMDIDVLLDRLTAWQEVHDRADRLSAEWKAAALRLPIYRAALRARS